MFGYIDETRGKLYDDLSKLENDKKLLSFINTQSKTLKYVLFFYHFKFLFLFFFRNKGQLLHDDFEKFDKQFLLTPIQ
jgi:hypothetical protein